MNETLKSSFPPTSSDSGLALQDKIIKNRKEWIKHLKKIFHIAQALNRSSLGCVIHRRRRDKVNYDYISRRYDKDSYSENEALASLVGVAKDGRAIYIHVTKNEYRGALPKRRREFLRKMATTGALVGVAFDYSDAFDIIRDEKRKKRTYHHLKDSNGKTKKNADTSRHGNENP